MIKVSVRKAKHPRYSHVVYWREKGKAQRRWFTSAGEARVEAERERERLAGMLSGDDPLSVQEWAAVREARLHAVDLGAAVRGWREEQVRRAGAITIRDLVLQRVWALKKAGLSVSYHRETKKLCEGLAGEYGDLRVPDFTPAMAVAAISTRAAGANKRRAVLHGLFEWGKGMGLVRENPVAGIRPQRPKREELAEEPVTVLSPEESRRLLLACVEREPVLLPYVAIGLFAGLRVAELQRLTWEQVLTTQGFIEVRKSISKTRARRLVDMQPALRTILEQCPRGEGQVFPPNGPRMWDRVKKAAGWRGRKHWFPPSAADARPWPENALRDSFSSYHLALFKNAAETALQDGHSEAVLFRNYRELVTEAAAGEFWSTCLDLPSDWPARLQQAIEEATLRRTHKNQRIHYPSTRKAKARKNTPDE